MWPDQRGGDGARPDWTGLDQDRMGGGGPERHPWSRGFPSRIKDQGSDQRSRIRDPGSRIRINRSRTKDQRSRIKDQGSRIKDQGARTKDQGPRTKDQGPRTKDHGPWTLDQGPRIKDQGSRIKDQGPCFGMNEHPGRDTDVISRLSKSTIEDLSFYIGFTRIGSRIKDLIKDLGPWSLFWHEWPF